MTELRDKRGMTEAEAIAAYRKKNYPKPALTADICIFARALCRVSREFEAQSLPTASGCLCARPSING